MNTITNESDLKRSFFRAGELVIIGGLGQTNSAADASAIKYQCTLLEGTGLWAGRWVAKLLFEQRATFDLLGGSLAARAGCVLALLPPIPENIHAHPNEITLTALVKNNDAVTINLKSTKGTSYPAGEAARRLITLLQGLEVERSGLTPFIAMSHMFAGQIVSQLSQPEEWQKYLQAIAHGDRKFKAPSPVDIDRLPWWGEADGTIVLAE